MLLLGACQTAQVTNNSSTTEQSKTLYPPSKHLKDSFYQPILDSYGISMLPAGIEQEIIKSQQLVSGFEIITDKFEADLVRVTTQSQQYNNFEGHNSAFGESWELN